MPTHNNYWDNTMQPNLREQYILFLDGRKDSDMRRNTFCLGHTNSASDKVQMLGALELEISAMPIE